MKQKIRRSSNIMLAIVFALLLCIQASISQGESENATVVQTTVTTVTPATENSQPNTDLTTFPDASTAQDVLVVPETTAEPTAIYEVSTSPVVSAIPETTAAPTIESLPPFSEPTAFPEVSTSPIASAIPETTAAPTIESLPPFSEPTALPEVSTSPIASAIPETTEAPTTESLSSISEPTTTPEVSAAPDPSVITEISATPVIEDTAPTCDIPDCPHIILNENGITITICPLGEWMITHEQVTPAPLMEASLRSAPDLQYSMTEASLSGGDIQFSNFTAVVLDGTSQTATAAWSMNNIIDTRGTGDGWNVSLTLTQFKEWSGNGYVSSGDTLDPSSVRVNVLPEVNEVDELSSSAVQITVVGSATALDTGMPVKLLTSSIGEGMGSYSVSSMTITLSIPANVYAHTYKTDAIIALNTGP